MHNQQTLQGSDLHIALALLVLISLLASLIFGLVRQDLEPLLMTVCLQVKAPAGPRRGRAIKDYTLVCGMSLLQTLHPLKLSVLWPAT